MYRYTLSVTSVHVSFDMGSKINETGAPRSKQHAAAMLVHQLSVSVDVELTTLPTTHV
jgi:hypothetical protein